jgi:predicted nucleic acid-binding protein
MLSAAPFQIDHVVPRQSAGAARPTTCHFAVSTDRTGDLIALHLMRQVRNDSGGTSVEFADGFLRTTDIALDVDLDRELWQDAGRRFAEYAGRRRESCGDAPRRILADFVIGAHADSRTSGLISFNIADYRNTFPELRVISNSAQFD